MAKLPKGSFSDIRSADAAGLGRSKKAISQYVDAARPPGPTSIVPRRAKRGYSNPLGQFLARELKEQLSSKKENAPHQSIEDARRVELFNILNMFVPLEKPKVFVGDQVIQRLKSFLVERGLGQDYQISSAIADFEEVLASEVEKVSPKTKDILPEKALEPYKERADTSETAPKWGKRDKQKYKGYPSIFQFIVDYHPDIRTTGGLYERDHSLYQSYRTAMERRKELIEGGEKPEPFPKGFKPLLDRDTDIATRERPTPEQRKHARKILLREEQARKREKAASR